MLARLPDAFETKTISLQNGSIHDCRGCSYEACLHFAAQSRCFYGGSISDDVARHQPLRRDALSVPELQ